MEEKRVIILVKFCADKGVPVYGIVDIGHFHTRGSFSEPLYSVSTSGVIHDPLAKHVPKWYMCSYSKY